MGVPTYWDGRAALRQAAYDRQNNAVVANVSKAWDRASRQLDDDIDTIFGVYARKSGLTPQEAREYLVGGVPTDILNSLQARAVNITDPKERKKLEVILRTDAYRARISRIDAIKDSVRVGMTEAADAELSMVTPHLKNVSSIAYNRMMFDVQHLTGFGFQGAGVPSAALDTILKSRWAGISYSQSVWSNRDSMVKLLNSAIMEQVSIGKLSDPTMKELLASVDTKAWMKKVTDGMKSKFRDETQYAKYAANRLIRTESAYVAGQSVSVAYDECGFEEYEFVATLDNRTSLKCSDKDGKVYKVKEQEVGVNYPPLHPHCRSTTAPIVDGKSKEGLQRAARGKDGKSTKIPADMNYAEWKRWQDAGCPDVGEWRNRGAET
jgi:SPP1 gp7 family putative phage head morphogenesis protein